MTKNVKKIKELPFEDSCNPDPVELIKESMVNYFKDISSKEGDAKSIVNLIEKLIDCKIKFMVQDSFSQKDFPLNRNHSGLSYK